MIKGSCFDIVNKFMPLIQNENIKYCFVIPIEVHITCAIYKFSQGVNLLLCNELFVIGRSTIYFVVEKVITIVNVAFKNLISWCRNPKWMQA
jgi:hypothetical protein